LRYADDAHHERESPAQACLENDACIHLPQSSHSPARFLALSDMAARSAGILLYRRRAGTIEVLLAHPGGPFWQRRDAGAWTIPKGEFGDDESAEAAARREFREEIGIDATGSLTPLGEAKQKGGKLVIAFAVEGDFDVARLASNTFEIEWPPRSGRRERFPEIDKVEWMPLATARSRILAGQLPLLERLSGLLVPS
jgi:predicted NUDIX family NTP pyrophosphohydrolase